MAVSSSQCMELSPSWRSADASVGRLIEWIDLDGDGWLDLALLDGGLPPFAETAVIKVYKNNGGELTSMPYWQSPNLPELNSFAWADYDHDGRLDAACDFGGEAAAVYRTGDDGIGADLVWSASREGNFHFGFDEHAVQWADLDADGWSDLVVGFWAQVEIFRNEQGTLSTAPDQVISWQPLGRSSGSGVASIALTDCDRDGFPELAVSYTASPFGGGVSAAALFYNRNGVIDADPEWQVLRSGKIGFANVNGDDLPDLTLDSWVYLNHDGHFIPQIEFGRNAPYAQFGDIDGDGYDDIAYAMDERNEIFMNRDGALALEPSWRSEDVHRTGSIALADFDGNGFADLATANFDGHIIYQPVYAGMHRNDGSMPPNGPPRINAFGLWTTDCSAGIDCHAMVMAWIVDPSGASDIMQVELTVFDQPSGVFLNDEGRDGDLAAGDGLYAKSFDGLFADPVDDLELGVTVSDREGYVVSGGPYYDVPYRW